MIRAKLQLPDRLVFVAVDDYDPERESFRIHCGTLSWWVKSDRLTFASAHDLFAAGRMAVRASARA